MGIIIDFIDYGGVEMKTIWDNIEFSPNKRPAYTKYEISKMIRNKREELGLTKEELAEKYDTDPSIIEIIELAKRNFNMNIYNICAKILGKSVQELIKFDEEELELCVSLRNEGFDVDGKAKETVDIANYLFNEIVMQHKINS